MLGDSGQRRMYKGVSMYILARQNCADLESRGYPRAGVVDKNARICLTVGLYAADSGTIRSR